MAGSVDFPQKAAERILAQVQQNSEESIEFFQKVVQIESIWGNEKPLAEFLAEKYRGFGFEAELQEAEPDRPNALGRLPGSDPGAHQSLILNGHMDVYPLSADWPVDPFAGIISDGKLIGAGSCDMKAGLCAMIMAAKGIRDAGVQLGGDLILLAIPGHFEGGVGTRHALNQGLTADMAVVCEPSELKISIAQMGACYLRITTIGRQAHTSAKDRGINAIEKMMKVIDGLHKLELTYEPHSLINREPILNIGTIEGGTKHNHVPDRCSITIDYRILPSQTPEETKKEVEAMLDSLAADDSEFRYECEFIEAWLKGPRYSTEIAANHPLVEVMKRAVAEATDKPAEIMGFPAWTDTAVFNDAGIPSISCGPGGPPFVWAGEYVRLEEFLAAIRAYSLAALRICTTKK
jgi:acetylornithine deacetylase/succinyl-diaminopimelate desuccinylase family protein